MDWLDDAAVALLADMPLWRLRAVERIELSSAFWSERHREIHVRSLKGVLREKSDRAERLLDNLSNACTRTLDGDDSIELFLPITEMPKVPLLDLRISVAGKQVYRMSKDESARIVAKHVIQLARDAGLMSKSSAPPHLFDFMTFLFYHPSASYENIVRRYLHHGYYSRDGYPDFVAQREYLCSKRSAVPFNLENSFPEWMAEAKEIAKVAQSYVIPDYLSGAENPLIGIPYFFEELERRCRRHPEDVHVPQPDARGVGELLAYVRTAVTKAHNGGKPTPSAHRFLTAYFAYGYRWMVFAKCRVPFNRDFTITVEDRRAIYFQPERGVDRYGSVIARLISQHSWHMVAFADAETNHASIRVSDTAVRLKTRSGWPKVRGERKELIDDPGDEEESTFELYLRQDSTESRPERIYFESPLRLTRIQSWMLNLTIGITVFAFMLLVRRIATDVPDNFVDGKFTAPSHGLTAKDVTVILIPVAFAAAFLLIRENSTLSMQIRQVRQTILMGALFALLAAAFVLLWAHYLKIG